ncbi:MAG: UvrD-helicase domain-containing protein [Desulfuromonadales bacterium]|nr:UvrD-helicase domain-containing protein [Desulfuromonadales bacterium]
MTEELISSTVSSFSAATASTERPIDWQERQQAVDISQSCVVQAPAGSGKTELLIQRILALLAVAERPEEILAITFTRKAAAEMRARLIQAMLRAGDETPPKQPHALDTWRKARAVLERDRDKGWNLTQNPARLQLMTVDSFCSALSRRMPWLARFGAQPSVTDDAAELYRLAAERVLAQLDRGGMGQNAVAQLLGHLDNRMTMLRELLVDMLGKRDQWLRHLLSKGSEDSRRLLESSLERFVADAIAHTREALGGALCCELMELADYAASNLVESATQPHALTALAQADLLDCDDLEPWLGLAHLLLTGTGTLRKRADKNIGFPADKTADAVAMKQRMHDLLELLRERPNVIAALASLRELPEVRYSAQQWTLLQALIELLPLCVVELKSVFQQRGQVDFAEIAGAAHLALGQADAPEELLLQLDSQIRHILVDEFQDTSYAQYDLLQRLTSGWEPDDGRTLFIVGDPMQSIYRFREADVGLYLRVCEQGLDNIALQKIVLRANFRSQKKLVDWVNTSFSNLFPEQTDQLRGAVPFAASSAVNAELSGEAVTCHAFLDRQDANEADRVLKLVQQARQERADATVAVLVRSRSHLQAISARFKLEGVRFQAQEIDALAERPVVQDLLTLTRALLHPGDRIAWLALLRAPWCGLLLDDLLALCADDARSTLLHLLKTPRQQQELFDDLSADGRMRLQQLLAVMEAALQRRGRLPLRRLVESAWLSLAGPACVDEAALLDAEQVFALLEKLCDGGELAQLDALESQIKKLYAAPDPLAGPELQLMTIHKAKGLEFDVVILPGLGRRARSQDRSLLRWLEHPDYELLLAPLPPAFSDAPDPTYHAIGTILREKEILEAARLLYVAATRAKKQLHLLGHVRLDKKADVKAPTGSFLEIAWESVANGFLNPVEAAQDDVCAQAPLLLQRLPQGWRQPAMPTANVLPTRIEIAQASSSEHDVTAWDSEQNGSRQREEGRIIGVVAHDWLERIAKTGPQQWSVSSLDDSKALLKTQLCSLGLPDERLETALLKVKACLKNALESDRGRWLLSAHDSAASELAINGTIDGRLMHAVVDRTFIDESGVRWIVDYKTSRPEPDRAQSEFMARELERYAGQLKVYRQLLGALEPGREIRCALYFPMFDGWIEVADEMSN